MEVFESLDQKKTCTKKYFGKSMEPFMPFINARFSNGGFFTHGTHWRYDLMEGDKLSNKAAPRIDAPWDDLAGNIGAMKSMVFTLKARNQCFFFKRKFSRQDFEK